MDFLREGGFNTLTSKELADFVDGRISVPAKSVALYVNQDTYHFPEFEAMIGEFKNRGFTASVFLENEGQFNQEMQDKMTNWVNEGVISLGTNLKIDGEKCPVIYPRVASTTLNIISANGSNNPRAILLTEGLPFDRLLFANLTPVTLAKAESVSGGSYPELKFMECRYLPTSREQSEHLTKPEGIIIHTTDQSGLDWDNWEPDNVFGTFQARGVDTSFGVGRRRTNQFLKMYKDVVTPTRGASGFGNYFSIEMCGRDFNDILNPSTDAGKRRAIEEVSANTVRLVVRLMDSYKISLDTVLGHYAATASGKTDPGQKYMENYFLPLLRSAVPVKRETVWQGNSRRRY
jgi:hypothetical protein